MTARTLLPEEFQSVVAFHGCYCLDIAVGYRVTKALMREMGDDMRNLKQVVAYTGAPTCAVDAIQQLAGCTLGKRNLHYTNTGKSTFVLHNTATGKAGRAYWHYWDHYDHDALRRCRQAASGPDATPSTNRPCRRCSTRGELDTVVAGRGLDLVGARRLARAAEVLEIPVGAVRGLR